MRWVIGYNKEIKRLVHRMIDKWEANPENENEDGEKNKNKKG